MHALLWEIMLIGVLVFVASLGLHYLAYKKGLLEAPDTTSEQHILAQLSTQQNTAGSHPLIKKWLTFGGGYYGIIAFVKLILIELAQARELATNWQGLDSLVQGSGLSAVINLAVAFFVEQFHNFGEAISWPADYVSRFSIGQCAVFVIVTYVIFSTAKRLAWQRCTHRQGLF